MTRALYALSEKQCTMSAVNVYRLHSRIIRISVVTSHKTDNQIFAWQAYYLTFIKQQLLLHIYFNRSLGIDLEPPQTVGFLFSRLPKNVWKCAHYIDLVSTDNKFDEQLDCVQTNMSTNYRPTVNEDGALLPIHPILSIFLHEQLTN